MHAYMFAYIVMMFVAAGNFKVTLLTETLHMYAEKKLALLEIAHFNFGLFVVFLRSGLTGFSPVWMPISSVFWRVSSQHMI